MSQPENKSGITTNAIQRQIKALENLIIQKTQTKPKSKQSLKNQILKMQQKPQNYMEKMDLSSNQSKGIRQDQEIIKSSLLQDIGNIDLQIQKMTEEYETPLNKTNNMNSKYAQFNLQTTSHQSKQTDVSKSDHQISINKIQNANDIKQQYFNNKNHFAEVSYSKLAESMRNYLNQKKLVEVKITEKTKTMPYNILSTKNKSNLSIKKATTSDIINSQKIMKTLNPKISRLSSKINSERNKTTYIKPILKQTSYHSQDFGCNQNNLNPNISKQLDDMCDGIKININDDQKLDKAVKIYNSLKQLVYQNSKIQPKIKNQKDQKNQIPHFDQF